MSQATEPARYALVLAAGKGTRFKSDHAKVLHPLCGRLMVTHVLDQLAQLDVAKTFVVVGHQAEEVREALRDYDVEFVLQKEQLGTGHAVMAATDHFRDLEGNMLVLYGDAPLIRAETLQRLFETQEREKADLVLLTCLIEPPCDFGRIIRDRDGEVVEIIEERDTSPEQKLIREVNPGFYCFRIPPLVSSLPRLSAHNVQGEYYLTDLLAIFRQSGLKIATESTDSRDETRGVNDRKQLVEVRKALMRRIADRWLLEGVILIDPDTTYIDDKVQIGANTIIYPGVILEGDCRIGSGCTVYGHSYLRDVVLEDGVTVDHCSVLRDSTVGEGSVVGPFAHLRQNTVVGAGSRVGSYVELKDTTLGDGTIAAHLTYLGDAEIGRRVNVGAGTITCNYDGHRKNKTIVEDDVFIGSDVQLVAPVTIERGAWLAAGSCITENVPPESLAIARQRQINKKGWVRKKK